MKDDPSRFLDPERPVENMAFYDVEHFLLKAAELSGIEELKLPTEAEWEYSCRAGTQGATYVSPSPNSEESKTLILDAVAWYGGNSGSGYEFGGYYQGSDWPNKLYPHKKPRSRKVKTRLANPWGLYDMLGKVLEWCLDSASPDGDPPGYSAKAVVDPLVVNSNCSYQIA